MPDIDLKKAVAGAARHFGLDAALVAAVVEAEGGTAHAIIRAVQCSVDTIEHLDDALDVVCRSGVHAMSDFIARDPDLRKMFVSYWGHRWAPVGAANDPHSLNANWPHNVLKAWTPAFSSVPPKE